MNSTVAAARQIPAKLVRKGDTIETEGRRYRVTKVVQFQGGVDAHADGIDGAPLAWFEWYGDHLVTVVSR